MIEPFELLWSAKHVQQEIMDVFGKYDASLWSLDAGTKKTFPAWLESGKPIADYYREEIGFVYQPAWNTTTNDERSKALAAVGVMKEFGLETALDYGAGIGTIAVPLAMYDGAKKVTAAEICLPCIKMLKARKKKWELDNLRIVDVYEKNIRPKVDFLVSTEVFEHVEDPIGLAKKLDKWLRPGGFALYSWSFVDMPTHLPQHFDSGLQHTHPDTITTEGFGKTVLMDQLNYKFVRHNWFNNSLWHKPVEVAVAEGD